MHFLVGDCGNDMKFGYHWQIDTLKDIKDVDLNCKITPVLFLDWGT